MKWIVQIGLYNLESYVKLIRALDISKADYDVVTVVPFSDILIPEPSLKDNKVFALGAYTMCEIAKNRGWSPGVFLNENFDYREMVKSLNVFALNHDAEFLSFAEVKIDRPKFIRPVLDTKTFSGKVFEPEEFETWKNNTIELNETGYTTLSNDTVVLVAEPKKLYHEYRFFIVDSKVSTASCYAYAGKLLTQYVPVPDNLVDAVNYLLEFYNPAPAFVLDIVETNNAHKVVEINCINGAGYYNADISKLVQDLSLFLEKYDK